MLTKKKTEKLLADAYDHLAVEKKDLSDTSVETARGDEWYLTGTSDQHTAGFMKPVLALTCLLLVFFGMNLYQNSFGSFATIYLDVNPSISVSINRNEKVLRVDALNEDAAVIIEGMDFRGSSLQVTVNALIGSLVQNGYINEVNNSLLVSVSDTDGQSGRQLEEELLNEISSILDNGSVLSQQILAGDNVKTLAAEYGISPGKAQLVADLADATGIYTCRELAGLTIHELNLLNKKTEEASTRRIGEPSDQAYIGIHGAIQAALAHAGIDESAARIEEAEIEYDGSRMIYEVEFSFDGYEYDCTVDAVSGTILRFEKDRSDSASAGRVNPSVDGIITPEQAKQAALLHLNMTDDQISSFEIELDYENGILKYDMEFVSGNQEYDCEADAQTGHIMKAEKETRDADEQAGTPDDDDDDDDDDAFDDD